MGWDEGKRGELRVVLGREMVEVVAWERGTEMINAVGRSVKGWKSKRMGVCLSNSVELLVCVFGVWIALIGYLSLLTEVQLLRSTDSRSPSFRMVLIRAHLRICLRKQLWTSWLLKLGRWNWNLLPNQQVV